jgi:hypothetical protein
MVIILIVYHLKHAPRGVTVAVRNVGSQPLNRVVIYVSGQLYEIGDISPHSVARCCVQPGRESSIELEFDTEGTGRKKVNAGGYVEAGIAGDIEVTLDSNKVIGFRANTTVRSY